MTTKLIFTTSITALLLFATCCKEEICACEDYEECSEGECELKANHFRWGDAGTISGSDLYHNVVEGNACIDTVVFNVKPNNEFSLFVIAKPSIRNAGIFINREISDTEYIFGVGDAMCYDKGWYADIVCKLFVPDSVQMKFLFYSLSDPGNFVDSTSVTLFK
jgi:hypothetical protein